MVEISLVIGAFVWIVWLMVTADIIMPTMIVGLGLLLILTPVWKWILMAVVLAVLTFLILNIYQVIKNHYSSQIDVKNVCEELEKADKVEFNDRNKEVEFYFGRKKIVVLKSALKVEGDEYIINLVDYFKILKVAKAINNKKNMPKISKKDELNMTLARISSKGEIEC